jgi:hypothetical protein
MRAHKIKCWPEPYAAIERGDKTCELRKADRDYRVSDYLMLMEFVPSTDSLTGKYLFREITHILTGDVVPRALLDGFVVLSIRECGAAEHNALVGNSEFRRPEWIAAPLSAAS